MKMKNIISFGVSLFVTLLISTVSFAEENNMIQGTHDIYREKIILKEDGTQEKIREEAKSALPGEELVGVLSYKYVEDKEADNSVLTMKLQKEFIYVVGSATDEEYVWFSIDGGKNYARFADLRKTDAQGVQTPITGKDITHLQWRHPRALKKGDSGSLEYRVIIRQ